MWRIALPAPPSPKTTNALNLFPLHQAVVPGPEIRDPQIKDLRRWRITQLRFILLLLSMEGRNDLYGQSPRMPWLIPKTPVSFPEIPASQPARPSSSGKQPPAPEGLARDPRLSQGNEPRLCLAKHGVGTKWTWFDSGAAPTPFCLGICPERHRFGEGDCWG